MTSKAADRTIFLGVAAAFALVLAWLAPSRLVLAGDDFGYVDSVVATIRAQRVVASDWLEPLNIPLPALSAGLFALTDNFYASTLGLNLLLALAGLLLLEINLRGILPDARVRWPLALAVVLSPVWLHKAVEFTGVPLGLAILLAAWWCWRRGWKRAFFLCVLLGALNRQSALCLLAWPLAALFQQVRGGQRLDRVLIIGGLVTAGVVGAILFTTPAPWARQLSQSGSLAQFSAVSLAANVLLAGLVLAGWRAFCGLVQGNSVGDIWRRNRARPWRPLGCMFAGVVLVWSGAARVLCETPGLEPYALGLVMLAALLAWLLDWDRPLPFETAAYLGLYVLLVSWRGRWWDYYFLEPMLVLLLAAPGEMRRGPAGVARAVTWAALALCLAALPGFKRRLADAETKVVAYEQALRRGDLEVRELSDAPFGFLGWKLFPFARQQPGAAALIDFLKFVEGGRARCVAGLITVDRQGGRKSIHPTGERWSLPAGFTGRFLPLNNAEWRDYIHRRQGP